MREHHGKQQKDWVEKTTRILFPGVSNKKQVSIQQLDEIFGKQLFGKTQKQQQVLEKPLTKRSVPPSEQQKQQLVCIKKPKTSRQKKVETPKILRTKQLRRMNIQQLKDLCLTRYRIDCGQVRKKQDVVSVLIEKEFPEKHVSSKK